MVLAPPTMLLRHAALLHRSALQLQPLMRSSGCVSGPRFLLQPSVALRAFSSNIPPPVVDAPTPVKVDKPKDEPLTNKKLWDRVLANHPEQDDRKNSDLLYDYPRKSYFGILSAGSLAHIAFWSWLKGYEQSLVEMLPNVGEPTFFSFVTNEMGSSIGFGSSIMLAFLIGFHARRAVARISVVSGGDKLRITTHKFLGDLGEPFDVPVANVSAHPNTKKNIILKVGKDRGFYLVDINGQFYNRAKLENMITFRTDFTEHEKMMEEKDKAKVFEVRMDLPRTDLKAAKTADGSTGNLPKRIPFHAKGKGNLLGRKPTQPRKPKTKK